MPATTRHDNPLIDFAAFDHAGVLRSICRATHGGLCRVPFANFCGGGGRHHFGTLGDIISER